MFYVTDLSGDRIESAQRQAAIKRALISVLTPPENRPTRRPQTEALAGE